MGPMPDPTDPYMEPAANAVGGTSGKVVPGSGRRGLKIDPVREGVKTESYSTLVKITSIDGTQLTPSSLRSWRT